MKKFSYAITLMIFLVSCTTTEKIKSINRENLSKLQIGFSKQEVLQLMGTKTIETNDGSKYIINNPWKSEWFTGSSSTTYEVIYYYTDTNKADRAITEDELTPIILENNKVIGWGWSSFKSTITGK